jgi:cytochrome c553
MLRRASALILLLTSGCPDGSITSSSEPDAGADPAAAARAAFDADVAPLLTSFCGACHVAAPPAFMAPDPDMYATVMAWPGLIDLDTPSASRLLVKGAHAGPAWTADQLPTIQAWIQLEADAREPGEDDNAETAAFDPIVGINTIDLEQLGLPGATISFRLEKLQVGFYISELMANAGTDGLHLIHPLFVSWIDGTPTPDPVDRFAGIELDIAPETSAMIGGGTAVMVDLPPTAQLSLHFESAAAANGSGGGGGDGGGGLGGCKDVAAFTANARPALSASCASCHAGGNAAATNATDLSRIDDLSPEGQAIACAQTLSRVSLAAPDNSGIFLAPDPNSGAGHPF